MFAYAPPLARLIEELSKLPTVGPKTAQRLAFHLLAMSPQDAEALARGNPRGQAAHSLLLDLRKHHGGRSL